MRDALIILADGLEECQALIVYDVLTRGGLKVDLRALNKDYVTSTHGVKIKAEVLSEKDYEEEYRLVFLPGGMPGAENLRDSKMCEKIVKKANYSGHIVSAICASPALCLGSWGLLEGHEATCFPSCASFFPSFSFSKEGVVKSGNIISGKSVGYAMDLALTLLDTIKGKDVKNTIKKEMYYREDEV